jgi:hypothetical protein
VRQALALALLLIVAGRKDTMASQSSRLLSLEAQAEVAPEHESRPECFEERPLRPAFFRAILFAVPVSLAMWAGLAWLAVQTIR